MERDTVNAVRPTTSSTIKKNKQHIILTQSRNRKRTRQPAISCRAKNATSMSVSHGVNNVLKATARTRTTPIKITQLQDFETTNGWPSQISLSFISNIVRTLLKMPERPLTRKTLERQSLRFTNSAQPLMRRFRRSQRLAL